MGFSRYLAAVNSALNELVLPEIQSSRGRIAVLSSIRVLAGIAAALETATTDTISFAEDPLPPALRGMTRAARATDAALCLPDVNPVPDLAISVANLPFAIAAAKWLGANEWDNEPALRSIALTLLDRDEALRGMAMTLLRKFEKGFAAPSSAGGDASDIRHDMLQAYLRDRTGDRNLHISPLRIISGRGSRQTALFSMSSGSGAERDLVIQRDDPRGVFAFTVVTQFVLLERVHAEGLRVPKPWFLESSREHLGAPFMVVERLPGSAPVDGMNYFDPPPEIPGVALGLARELARLHCVPIGDLWTVLTHSVDPGRNEKWSDLLDRYESLWNSLAHTPSLAVTAALSWMRQHVGCVDSARTIVHGDALLHNLLAEGDDITALLDWELAHIGHPAEDLGYVKPIIEQTINWDQFMEAYYQAGGYRITAEQLDFFTLLPLLKLVTQAVQGSAAFDGGQTGDLVLAECGTSFLPKLIDRLAGQLRRILQP